MARGWGRYVRVLLVTMWCYGVVCLLVALTVWPHPHWTLGWGIDLILRAKTDDPSAMASAEYLSNVTSILAAWAFLSTAWLKVMGCLRKRRNDRLYEERLAVAKKEIYRKQGFDVEPVMKKGKDDLKWMQKYYKNAGMIIVFAGSFDWLDDYKPLRKTIVRLARANKITLISYRDERVVREALSNIHIPVESGGNTNLYDELKDRFYFNSGLRIICSLVWDKLEVETRFLYRSPSKEHAFNVCVLLDTEHSKLLVKIIGDLIEARYWGVQAGERVFEHQDARDDLHDASHFQVR